MCFSAHFHIILKNGHIDATAVKYGVKMYAYSRSNFPRSTILIVGHDIRESERESEVEGQCIQDSYTASPIEGQLRQVNL